MPWQSRGGSSDCRRHGVADTDALHSFDEQAVEARLANGVDRRSAGIEQVVDLSVRLRRQDKNRFSGDENNKDSLTTFPGRRAGSARHKGMDAAREFIKR